MVNTPKIILSVAGIEPGKYKVNVSALNSDEVLQALVALLDSVTVIARQNGEDEVSRILAFASGSVIKSFPEKFVGMETHQEDVH